MALLWSINLSKKKKDTKNKDVKRKFIKLKHKFEDVIGAIMVAKRKDVVTIK